MGNLLPPSYTHPAQGLYRARGLGNVLRERKPILPHTVSRDFAEAPGSRPNRRLPSRPGTATARGSRAESCVEATAGYPGGVSAQKVPVHRLFSLLGRSLDDARAAIGADHALVPLEPWESPGGVAERTNETLTGRGHLVSTHAGRQAPVLMAEVYAVSAGDSLLLGRSVRANLIIDQPTVSRLHAELSWNQGQLVVADRGSYNGTLVNDHVLEQGESRPLTDGDVLVLGETQLVFGSLSYLAQLAGIRVR